MVLEHLYLIQQISSQRMSGCYSMLACLLNTLN